VIPDPQDRPQTGRDDILHPNPDQHDAEAETFAAEMLARLGGLFRDPTRFQRVLQRVAASSTSTAVVGSRPAGPGKAAKGPAILTTNGA